MDIDLCKAISREQWRGGCDFEMGVPDYIIFTPADISITETDADDLIAFLKSKALLTDEALKYYPVYGEIKRITDESSEPQFGTLDKGYSKQQTAGREILLLEWPSGVYSDRHIQRMSRYTGGCLIINNLRLLIGITNEDGTMGAMPVEVTAAFGGGFSGSGGDVQTMRLRVDLGAQDKLVATAMALPFKETDRFENIYPPVAP